MYQCISSRLLIKLRFNYVNNAHRERALEGRVKFDCSVLYAAICQPPCGENGVCTFNTGYCDCSPGFTGPSCDDGII